MMPLRLRIELISPLCSGSGEDRPAVVDREVATDRFGLPVIPARRIRGLLRDAYEQLWDAGALTTSGAASVESLFGSRGQIAGGSVRIATASLVAGQHLHEWMEGAAERHPDKVAAALSPEEIAGLFTEIRAQTAMDRETGGPRKDTLRLTRVVSAGEEFVAQVDDVGEFERRGLALAAGLVREMGTTRSRGLGEVRCRLEQQDEKGQWADLTEVACQLLATGKLAERKDATPLPSTAAVPAVTSGLKQLAYTLELTQPAVIPELAASDPNTQTTHDYVPGTVMHGVLAMRLGPAHPDFARLFCQGKVAFLNATPLVTNGKSQRVRGLPVPHSVRTLKEDPARAVDLTRDRQESEPIQRIRDVWWDPASLDSRGAQPRCAVSTDLVYHHARPVDKSFGRPVGAENQYDVKPDEAGALFVYESISPGQMFRGEIAGSSVDLGGLKALVADGETLLIGRSRGAQYGGRAILKWVDAAYQGAAAGPASSVDRLRITLESSLIASNEFGQTAPEFPAGEVEAALGCAVKVKESYVRTVWHGGYLSHQKLPRQQSQALAAGSVFMVQLSTPVEAATLAAASGRSYGMRIEEGFGRLRMEPAADTSDERGDWLIWKQGVGGPPRKPATFSKAKPDAAVWPSIQELAYAKLDRHFGATGYHSDRMTEPRSLRRSLVHRLLEVAQRPDGLAKLAAELGGLRKTARNQLEAARFKDPGKPVETLIEFLQRLSGPTGSMDLFFRLATKAWPWEELSAHPLLSADNSPREPVRARESVRRFVVRYLGALSRRLLIEQEK